MKESFVLTFNTSTGSTKTINVPDPDPAMTAGGVTVAANRIIASNLFDLIGLKKAEKKSVSKTPVDL